MSGVVVGAAVIGGVASNIAANKAKGAAQAGTDAQLQAQREAMQKQEEAYRQVAPGLAQFLMPHTRAPFAASWADPNAQADAQTPTDGQVPGQPAPLPGRFGTILKRPMLTDQAQVTGAPGQLPALGEDPAAPLDELAGPVMTDPLEQLRAAAGVYGPEAQAAYYQNFQEDPGTAFLREQGQLGLNQQASAAGGLGGGSRLKAISEFNQGLANQMLGNRLSQLGSLASTDIGLAGSLANLRTGLGNAQAAGLQNMGASQAAGLQAAGQADAARIQGWGNALSQGIGGYFGNAAAEG